MRFASTLNIAVIILVLSSSQAYAQGTLRPGFKGIEIGSPYSRELVSKRFVCETRARLAPEFLATLPADLRKLSGSGQCRLRLGERETIAQVPVLSLYFEFSSDDLVTQIGVTFDRRGFTSVLQALRERYGEETRVTKREDGVPLYDWLLPGGAVRLMETSASNGSHLLVLEKYPSPAGADSKERARDL
jgi:hypothetical protein